MLQCYVVGTTPLTSQRTMPSTFRRGCWKISKRTTLFRGALTIHDVDVDVDVVMMLLLLFDFDIAMAIIIYYSTTYPF